jgi:hypothetical protein
MRGITLLAIGKPEYGNMAYNMALSIKYYNPEIKIKLVYEPSALSGLFDFHKEFFDIMQVIELDDTHIGGAYNPGKAKLSIYKYLEFDENIYLDVDGAAIKDLNPLFDECEATGEFFLTQYLTHITGVKSEFKEMMWAYPKDIWEAYGFNEQTQLPATNSSFMYIKKCEQAEAFFKQAVENISNPMPFEKHRLKWGQGKIRWQPDELYLNITMAQFGILGKLRQDYPIFFNNQYTPRMMEQLNNYYLIGMYGGLNFTHHTLLEYYDRLIHAISMERMGRAIDFKMKKMVKAKR